MKINKIILIGIIALIFSVSVVYAAFDSTKPWHPLEQVTTTIGGGTSVDRLGVAGYIDNSDNANFATNANLLDAKDSTEFCWTGTANCASLYYTQGSKVADSDTLDSIDSTGFLKTDSSSQSVNSAKPKVTNLIADKLDSYDSTDFCLVSGGCGGGSGGVESLNGLTGAVTLTHTGGLINSITTPGGNVIRINADTTFGQDVITSGNIYVQANAPSGWLHARRINSSSYIMLGADHLVSYGTSGAMVFDTRNLTGNVDGFYWRSFNDLSSFEGTYDQIMKLANEGDLTLYHGNVVVSNGNVDVNKNLNIYGDIKGNADDRLNIYSNSDADNSRAWIEMFGYDAGGRTGELALAGTYVDLRYNSTTTRPGQTGLRLDSTGKVGIGTTSPTQKLDVSGQIHASGDICTDVNGKCLSSVGGTEYWSKNGNNIYYNNGGVLIGLGLTSESLEISGSAEISGTGKGNAIADGTVYSWDGGSGELWQKAACTKDGTNCPILKYWKGTITNCLKDKPYMAVCLFNYSSEGFVTMPLIFIYQNPTFLTSQNEGGYYVPLPTDKIYGYWLENITQSSARVNYAGPDIQGTFTVIAIGT